ncbi:MAG TPA: hypothetical protein PK264_08940 [Hyphomicrobiaceae bacterium]|nr:hypothetical protein [Hyphomicrobiaceae bacterium]
MQFRWISAALFPIALAAALGGAVAQSPTPAPPAPGGPQTPRFNATPGDGWSPPEIDCKCIYKGRAYSVGSVVCMDMPQGAVLTTCGMVLNNTSWQPSAEPCHTSWRLRGLRFAVLQGRVALRCMR